MEQPKMERNFEKEVSILHMKLSEANAQATMWQSFADDKEQAYQELKKKNNELQSELNKLKDSSDKEPE